MNRKEAEEKVKLSRIARIDAEIRAGNYPNSEELAAKMEVSPRTILRDIDYLRYSYDAPIEYDFFKKGFYYTEPNFFIKSVMLTKDDVETLTIYDQFTKLSTRDDDDFSVKFRKIIDKFLLVLPESHSNNLPFSPTPISPDFLFQPSLQIEGKINSIILEAIKSKNVIEVEYWFTDNRKYKNLLLEPIYVFHQKHQYYLLAFEVNNKEKPGIYSINRFRKAEKKNNYFEIPSNFKISDYINKKTVNEKADVSPADNKLYHFELSFPKEIAEEAIEKTYYPNQAIKLCDDGTVYVSFRTTQLHEVFYWVRSEGCKRVKALNPPELVAMMKAEAQRMRNLYV